LTSWPPPRIQPGHVPQPESKDERGLWMEMADFEKQLAASPMLVRDPEINNFGRTEFLLERHAAMGLDPALVDYYRGEMYRQRGGEGDAEAASEAYLRSIAHEKPYPPSFRNLGYLALKAGDGAAARRYFERYLALAPEADDREMIGFYLEDLP
jgi:tetratricopeptide (TPR) repeat protein